MLRSLSDWMLMRQCCTEARPAKSQELTTWGVKSRCCPPLQASQNRHTMALSHTLTQLDTLLLTDKAASSPFKWSMSIRSNSCELLSNLKFSTMAKRLFLNKWIPSIISPPPPMKHLLREKLSQWDSWSQWHKCNGCRGQPTNVDHCLLMITGDLPECWRLGEGGGCRPWRKPLEIGVSKGKIREYFNKAVGDTYHETITSSNKCVSGVYNACTELHIDIHTFALYDVFIQSLIQHLLDTLVILGISQLLVGSCWSMAGVESRRLTAPAWIAPGLSSTNVRTVSVV